MKDLQFSNGDCMPILGLGTWKSAPGEIYAVIREAIQLGYRHIDCAPVYGNEAEIGEAISAAIAAGDVTRKDLWITSKLWCDAHIATDVRPALEKTLSDLQLDYLDLYLIHWPIVFKPGAGFPQDDEGYLSLEQVPTIETWGAMESCVDAGLIKQLGVSNFSAYKVTQLCAQCRIKPVINQVELHPLLQQEKLKQSCADEGVYLTAYSPLGSGDRPAIFKSDDDPDLMALEQIKTIALAHKVSSAQILLAWAVNRGTSVIPKSVRTQRLQENLAAADIMLSDDDMQQIQNLDRHHRLVSGTSWGGPNTLANLWDEEML